MRAKMPTLPMGPLSFINHSSKILVYTSFVNSVSSHKSIQWLFNIVVFFIHIGNIKTRQPKCNRVNVLNGILNLLGIIKFY